ncbi:hypothetical protein [Halostella litorea]|uniref:hypothetical protein n=1 Tax=Halostella litorea TaxID=2528831 RepID=UPI00109242CE|nr:hypothetical protein [Halostella litorea]
MSSHIPDPERSEPDPFEDVQSDDEADLDAVLEGITAEGQQRQADEQRAEHQATVRSLVVEARQALTGQSPRPVEDLLLAIHWHLREHPDLSDVLAPWYDGEYITDAEKLEFRDQMGLRDRQQSPPDPMAEFETQARLGKELGYLNSLRDPSNYAPVRLEKLDPDEVPHAPDIDEVTPIGRRRVGAGDAANLENKEVVIPHDDCDHILAIAKPREGKDSTLTSIGVNLWREHGYKYVSLHDDGRMETPMLSIPNDEKQIRENLKWFNQQPKAMDTEVFVPRMEGVPDVLPANFQTFTLGIDMLTPNDILRLAGVTESDPSMEMRIKEALKITLNRSEQVDELINLLFDFAEGLEATISWTELRDKHQDGEYVETYETSMELPAEKAVRKATQRLGRLASEGFITSPEAATNIDFHEMIRRNHKSAVLCCNFIDASDGFKYTIMDLWLQKIMAARDEDGRLPRVCLEVRELKNVAPSQIQHARYRDQIRALQQTFRIITSQGGSRRVLLLGSTQKFNDILRPVRNNMDTKILLRQSQEQVGELHKTFEFDSEQFQQLRTFNTGQGMIYADGEPYWPIQWRGAPCGLGLGDRVWRDRYGLAWGARVRETGDVPWLDSDAPPWWVDVITGDVVRDDRKPSVGGWYLLPDDFPAPIAAVEDAEQATEQITSRLIQWVLRQRREYRIPSNLQLEPVGGADRQRDITLEQIGQETTHEDIAKRHDIPPSIKAWLRKAPSTRKTYIEVCEIVANGQYDSYNEIYTELDPEWSEGTFRNHAAKDDGLSPCLDNTDEGYTLRPVGRKVLEIDWGAVETGLQEVGQ